MLLTEQSYKALQYDLFHAEHQCKCDILHLGIVREPYFSLSFTIIFDLFGKQIFFFRKFNHRSKIQLRTAVYRYGMTLLIV